MLKAAYHTEVEKFVQSKLRVLGLYPFTPLDQEACQYYEARGAANWYSSAVIYQEREGVLPLRPLEA